MIVVNFEPAGKVMSQLGPSHTYAVQFTLSQVVHTQVSSHVGIQLVSAHTALRSSVFVVVFLLTLCSGLL